MADTLEDIRDLMDGASDRHKQWEGLPVPLADFKVRLYPGHRFAAKAARAEAIVAAGLNGPSKDFVCSGPQPGDDGYEEEVVVNHWFSYSRHCDVFVLRNTRTGRRSAETLPVSPDSSMDRLTYWLRTMGAADAWKVEAEQKAQAKLAGLLSARQARQYLLTGSFIETSPRSRVHYLFRRLRPTVAMTPRWNDPDRDAMRCLAVLCLHPVGYYEETWAGCMVPTDDVLAHLLLMRGDEAGFWKQANQHHSWAPEAGL